MVVIAILFWMWFLASVVVLVRRSIRRRRERRIRREATRVALHDSAGTAAAEAEAEVAATAKADVAKMIDAPVATASAPTPVAPAPPAPTRAPAAAPVATAAAAVSTPATATSAPSSVATIARAAAAPVTVAQVIAGIEMPCDLVPLTLSDHDMRYDRGQRAHFVTTLVPALAVMASLSEELERIGLTVSPIGETAAIAKRGRLAVELRINAIGALVDGVASTDFRSAPPNSVVVEFDVVPA